MLALDNGKECFVDAVRNLSRAIHGALLKRTYEDQRPEEKLEHAVREIVSRAVRRKA